MPAQRRKARSTEESDRADRIRSLRTGRRLALSAVFEAEFGQRTASAILERHLTETEGNPNAAELARRLVRAVVENRDTIDATIENLRSVILTPSEARGKDLKTPRCCAS